MTAQNRTAPNSRHDFRWLFGAVWLLFLGYPIAALVSGDLPGWEKALGAAILVAFVAVYLWLCRYVMFQPVTPARQARLAAGALVVLAASLLPILGPDAFGLCPYLMVAVCFSFTRGWRLLAMFAILAATVIIPELAGWQIDIGVIAIIAAVGFSMLAAQEMRAREVERERAEEKQRALRSEVAVIAERERVARDVHDILGHSLTVISVKTELAGRLIDLDPERAKSELAEVNSLAREALAEVRATVGDLRSPALPSVLAAAESALTAAGIEPVLPDPAIADSQHAALFAWVLREAVTNVVRHSGATRCEVILTPTRITVHDNGSGPGDAELGNGLRGLAERISDAGGRFGFDGASSGTTLTADLTPLA